MKSKIVKILYAVLLLAILVLVACFLVAHVKAGLQTVSAKVYLGLYIILIVWALCRLYTIIRELLGR